MAASQFDILGNTVTNSRGAGLWISGYGTPETLARVEGNVINQNGEGIVLTGPTRHVALRGNTVVQSKGLPSGDAASGAGISLQLTAPASTNNVTDLLFERNQISWNRGAGVNRLGGDLVPCKNLQLGASLR
jgi:nitrous oxidase accessory protein NosD